MPRAVDGVTRLSGGAASCFPTAAPLQSRPGVAVGGKSRESAAVGRVPEVVLNYTCMFFFFCILAFSCFLLLLPQTRVGVSSGRRSSSTRPALLHSSFHRARREIDRANVQPSRGSVVDREKQRRGKEHMWKTDKHITLSCRTYRYNTVYASYADIRLAGSSCLM